MFILLKKFLRSAVIDNLLVSINIPMTLSFVFKEESTYLCAAVNKDNIVISIIFYKLLMYIDSLYLMLSLFPIVLYILSGRIAKVKGK